MVRIAVGGELKLVNNWQPDATTETLIARANLLAAIRAFFAVRGVIEVDTPVLVAAAPSEAQLVCFEVGIDEGYLVPSPEHGLKRLLAAGSGPIYQLGHVFRAGEAGRWHNPEFTMLEWYRPDWTMAELITEVGALLAEVVGTAEPVCISFAELFFEWTGLDAHGASAASLVDYGDRAGVAPPDVSPSEQASRSFWLDLIMSTVITPKLGVDAPICVDQFPADDAVLISVRDGDPSVAERFEIYWQGQELANGAQELTDAKLARTRMQREYGKRIAAGLPVPQIDEKLLAAMEHGMPKCAGVAVGVDRLLALQQGANCLVDVLPFGWDKR